MSGGIAQIKDSNAIMNNAPPMMYSIVLESYRRLIQTSDATIISQI